MHISRKLLITFLFVFLICLLINLIRHYSIPSATYKKAIESFVATHTPYTLTIDGDTHVSLFPIPQLVIQQAILNKKNDSITVSFIAKAKEIDLQIPWSTLLSRQILFNQMTLVNANIPLTSKLILLFNGTIDLNKDQRTAAVSAYHGTINNLPFTGSATMSWTVPSNQMIDVTFSSTTAIADGLVIKEGQAEVNDQTKQVRINETIKAAHININPVFRAFNTSQPVNGSLTGSATLNANINNGSWLNSLSGDGNIAIKNATFAHLDLPSVVNRNLHVLSFDSVTGTFRIVNGILSNNDLMMSSKILRASGAGEINLDNSTIDYRLSLQEKSDIPPLPITIKGTLQHPKVSIDIKQTINNVVNTIIHDHKFNLKNIFN